MYHVKESLEYMQMMFFCSVFVQQEMSSPLKAQFKAVFPQSCLRNESGNKNNSDGAHIYQDLIEPN